MRIHRHLRLATAVAAFSILAASPALAQGKGKDKKEDRVRDRGAAVQQRQRPILQRRTDSDRRDDRYEDRSNDRYPSGSANRYPEASRDRYPDRDDDRYDRRDVRINDGRRAGVPPGWCKGRGNPHNTPENCGYSSSGRYDPRGNDRYGGNERYDGYRSYAEAHAAFHRDLDRRYDRLADQRRSDLIYQIRLRSEKAAEHNRWHERTGTRH